jgi:broad specificity phosphatase PhoE
MRLLLAPHARTDGNEQSRFQGQSDSPLSERGMRQARQLAQRLSSEPLAEICSSDLARARATAALVAEPHGLTVRSDSRLRELDFGNWEGLTYQDVQQADQAALAAWEADPTHAAPPRGETLEELARRVGIFFAGVREHPKATDDRHTLLIVAHRGSLRVLLCLALGLPAQKRWQLGVEHASLTELQLFPQGPVLNYLNDMHHLREAAHGC